MHPHKARVVSVAVEYLTHDEGHWCNTCMLGTGMRFYVAITGPGGMHLQERLWCYEREGSRGVVVDDRP